MKTLADILNAPKEAEISLEKCYIVKMQEDGTYNIACDINGARVYVNYVDINKCRDNKLNVRFGKKEQSWKKDRWYQVEPVAETETESTEEEA